MDWTPSNTPGKAGLARRQRFKVLEYHPDRGYVKIDTDGLQVQNKISVNRIMKAPKEVSVRDTTQPLTRVERTGDSDMQLPPGWQQVVRRGKTKDYVEYTGTGGDGHAKSVPEAWRKFNADPLLMPQLKPSVLSKATDESEVFASPNQSTPQQPSPTACKAS